MYKKNKKNKKGFGSMYRYNVVKGRRRGECKNKTHN
jgi:hypothetical protein